MGERILDNFGAELDARYQRPFRIYTRQMYNLEITGALEVAQSLGELLDEEPRVGFAFVYHGPWNPSVMGKQLPLSYLLDEEGSLELNRVPDLASFLIKREAEDEKRFNAGLLCSVGGVNFWAFANKIVIFPLSERDLSVSSSVRTRTTVKIPKELRYQKKGTEEELGMVSKVQISLGRTSEQELKNQKRLKYEQVTKDLKEKLVRETRRVLSPKVIEALEKRS